MIFNCFYLFYSASSANLRFFWAQNVDDRPKSQPFRPENQQIGWVKPQIGTGSTVID
jgi:hypothetical protein